MTSINTPQAFVRALKAPSDPPAHGGQLKIEIARQVWDDSSFLVPNKAEAVADWILGKFLKEKDKEIAVNPLLDLRYWTLLHDVISFTSTGGSSWTQTRPLKTWLPPLLSRVPFAPSLVALFHFLGRLDSTLRDSVVPVIFSSLEILWPVSAQKMNTEAILECFGAFLIAYYEAHGADHLVRIGSLIVTSYRNSVSYSSNKKKVYSVFLQSYLPYWLKLHAISSSEVALSGIIYNAGIETLFNLDTLRRIRDSKAENELLESIAPVLRSNDEVYSVLPRLFASYIESLKKHRGALVSQSSNHIPGSANAEIQTQGMQFLASCLSLLDVHEHSAKWSARVALMPAHAPYLNFLDVILAYHNKTRTVNTFTESLLNALSTIETASLKTPPKELYQNALSSPLFDATHLRRLSKSLQAFLSESQIFNLAQVTFGFLKQRWEKFDVEDDTEERSPKRRRTANMGSAGSTKPPKNCSAVIFSLSSHLAMTVFSSLPLHAVTKELKDELRSLLDDIRKFAARIVKKAMKPLTKSDQTSWSNSVVSAASLRLWYALDVSGNVTQVPFDDEKFYKRVSNVLQGGQLLLELLLELCRFLFYVSPHRDQSSSQAAFNHSLEYLEKNFQASTVSWSGQVHSLSLDQQGQGACALALLHMIVERWLPLIETFASTEQVGRLVRIIMSIGVVENPHSVSGLRAETLLLQVLHSAQFWELHELRIVFLQHVEQKVSAIDNISNTDPIVEAIGAYRLLLILPLEYLSRTNRVDFVRRALVLDRHISSSAMTPILKSETLTDLRTFLSRVFSIPNGIDFSVEHFCDALKHFMDSATSPAMTDQTLQATTASVVESIFFETFKKLQHSSFNVALDLISAFSQIDVRAIQMTTDFRAQSLMHMITVLEREFKFKRRVPQPPFSLSIQLCCSFPDEVQSTMQQLYQNLSMATYPQLLTLRIETASVEDIRSYASLIIMKIGDLPPLLATTLYPRLSAWNGDATVRNDIHIATLSILLEEFDFCMDHDRSSRLDYTIAAYTSTSNFLSHSGGSISEPWVRNSQYKDLLARQQVEPLLSRLCSGLSPSEFSQLLDLVAEDLNYDGSSEGRANLLQISAILLTSHPPGTLKHTQAFVSRCLQTILRWHDLKDGPIELRLRVLDFLAKHCTDQPAVLRIGDMGSIWSLITHFLAGSRVHDNDTTLGIFHKIVNIISALIRLRRDLVIHTLPHLGSVLRQLLAIVRTVRPSLGIKQTSLVTDTLPRWLNAKQPIGVEEVKVLARLLETLTTKYMVRNNAPNSETQKAESLAKPFSKHAAFVLKAYITAMNDPLCLLPSEHRKELQRGLYALCSMIGDHNRDAMMVSALDSGGKLTMKTLWKEYEKQRYVGKG
ncbi:hypothetical protein C0993_007448 [Termitomyces sp. T159_Od127]|nr:hypothetical protein C0993_007448 [Termitomyces sp. T159_Od127]